jgi:hypothetical protein
VGSTDVTLLLPQLLAALLLVQLLTVLLLTQLLAALLLVQLLAALLLAQLLTALLLSLSCLLLCSSCSCLLLSTYIFGCSFYLLLIFCIRCLSERPLLDPLHNRWGYGYTSPASCRSESSSISLVV